MQRSEQHPEPLVFSLLVDDADGHVRGRAEAHNIMAKLREIDRRLSEGGDEASTERLRAQRARLSEELETNYRSYLRDPADFIASFHPGYKASKTRVLAAQVPAKGATPRFLMYRDMDTLVHRALKSVVWYDPSVRNLPYSRECLYGLSEEQHACGVFVDAEEEFITPVVDDSPARLAERERSFMRRAIWIVALFRVAIQVLYMIDAGEKHVWYFTGCTAKKNSCHIYVPGWRMKTPAKLCKLVEEVRAIYASFSERHPCRVALSMDLRVCKAKKKDPSDTCIVDWSVYNSRHRQFRGAFQRKDPETDNAFVPYDVMRMSRVGFQMPGDEAPAMRYIRASFKCMALAPYTDEKKRAKRYEFDGDENESPLNKLIHELWRQLEEQFSDRSANHHKPYVQMIISMLYNMRLAFDGVFKGRLSDVYNYFKRNQDYLERTIRPSTPRIRYNTDMVYYRIYAVLLCTNALRYCYSRIDPNLAPGTALLTVTDPSFDRSLIPTPGAHLLEQVFMRTSESYAQLLEADAITEQLRRLPLTDPCFRRAVLAGAALQGRSAQLLCAATGRTVTGVAFEPDPRGHEYLIELHSPSSTPKRSSTKRNKSAADLDDEDFVAKRIEITEDTASGSPLLPVEAPPPPPLRSSGSEPPSTTDSQYWRHLFGFSMRYDERSYRR